ncbi:hypothetical protein U9M48_038977 [Paspalum notatum var. saurae]|uniref:Uncharacterized protein n=1 Tax=Paspalum notatum var. saurae TaxID=547442 RepID=A0AAQ3UMH5_PASNO
MSSTVSKLAATRPVAAPLAPAPLAARRPRLRAFPAPGLRLHRQRHQEPPRLAVAPLAPAPLSSATVAFAPSPHRHDLEFSSGATRFSVYIDADAAYTGARKHLQRSSLSSHGTGSKAGAVAARESAR